MRLLKAWRVVAGNILSEFFGGLILNGPIEGPLTTLTYGVSVAVDAGLSNQFQVSPTDGVAFAIAAPTNPPITGVSQLLTLTIRNGSGGALGAVTFNAIFKLAAWTQPANGFSRSITFRWNGTNWVEVSRTTVDVAN